MLGVTDTRSIHKIRVDNKDSGDNKIHIRNSKKNKLNTSKTAFLTLKTKLLFT